VLGLPRVAQTSSNWGAAVYCARVLRNSLIVADTKRRLRIGDTSRESLGDKLPAVTAFPVRAKDVRYPEAAGLHLSYQVVR